MKSQGNPSFAYNLLQIFLILAIYLQMRQAHGGECSSRETVRAKWREEIRCLGLERILSLWTRPTEDRVACGGGRRGARTMCQ